MFDTACQMGVEGIVSKRKDKAYASGPCKHWVKVRIRMRLGESA